VAYYEQLVTYMMSSLRLVLTLEKKILKTGKFMSSVYALKFKSTAKTGNRVEVRQTLKKCIQG
jgi:hypothetical protein